MAAEAQTAAAQVLQERMDRKKRTNLSPITKLVVLHSLDYFTVFSRQAILPYADPLIWSQIHGITFFDFWISFIEVLYIFELLVDPQFGRSMDIYLQEKLVKLQTGLASPDIGIVFKVILQVCIWIFLFNNFESG